MSMADCPDQDSSTRVSYTFDATGAPETLTWHSPTGDPADDRVTTVARNKAQRIIAQTTGCLSRNWLYDDLGRVTDTTVSGSGCTVQNGDLLYERMSYFDSSAA